MSFVTYTDSVEVKKPNEEKTFDDIATEMHRLSALMNDRYRHAVRSVHAKSHGLLKVELKIYDNLPQPFQQGLFAEAKAYPAIMRFSTNPGDILADSISTPRGLAVKVIGATGPMLPENQGQVTQDFVFVNVHIP